MDPQLIPVTTTFTSFNGAATEFSEPFNQASFFNYDPNNQVLINKVPLPPAITINGKVYPTVLRVNLNEMEVNESKYTFDFQNSASSLLIVIYTQYKGVGL